MGGDRAATVVIAQPDNRGRELLARIVEAAGQHAVRVGTSDPIALVDATVSSSALVLVVALTDTGLEGLGAVVGSLEARRYPAQVMALVDGPASASAATSLGAAAVLERPFPLDRFVTAINAMLKGEQIEVDEPVHPALGAEQSIPTSIHHDDLDLPVDEITAGSPAEVTDDGFPGSAGEATHSINDRTEDPTDATEDPTYLAEDPTADIDPDTAEDADAETTDPVADRTADETTDSVEDSTEDDPEAPPRRDPPAGLGHNFTDILKMGRQL